MTTPVTAPLGRLERVDLRLAWVSESAQFTPWLAEPDNIKLLGEVIHLDLEVESQERPVGPFRADILCKETTTGHYVLIENQLERTDHGHLGQLLTYAAGLDAVTIVWIAARFTDEHRAALDWLNRSTGENLNFFGLEVEVWRIGDSPLAPKFNVVSQPNDWVTTVQGTAAASAASSSTQRLHLGFWTQFRDFLEARGSPLVAKVSSNYGTGFPLGRSNFGLYAANGMRDGVSWVYLSLTGPDAKRHFNLLAQQRTAIESELGTLEWRELKNNVESQVRVVRKVDCSDSSTWPQLNGWLANHLESFERVFRPLVRSLDASEWLEPVQSQELG